MFQLSLFVLALLQNVLALPTKECPVHGPQYASDFDLGASSAMQNAIASFPAVIEKLFATEKINRTHTTFSIDVFSTVTNQSLYQYHHAAPGLNGSLTAGKLDEETIYRIGSVSKLYTSYAILAQYGSLDILQHPVTQYVPELKGNPSDDRLRKISYEDVTVGALMSHQGGTGGFPIEYVDCFDTHNCSENAFLATMRNGNSPVTPPFAMALYSDAGFGILGQVLEKLTGMSYNDAIKHVLAEPLHLNSSTAKEPVGKNVNGVALSETQGGGPAWGYDGQITAPSGGIYSNNADLRRLGMSIMHSELLSSTQTRQWMQPHAVMSSLSWAVGAPWEINRLALPVSASSTRTRMSDLYTKSGGQSGYSAIFALSPDHQLGFSVLLAGVSSVADRWPLRAAVGETFITAAEWAAADNAEDNFAGSFVHENDPTTNLTLSIGTNHPGLNLESLYIEGVESRSFIIDPTGLKLTPGTPVDARLYPSGIEQWTAQGTKQMAFRAFAQYFPIPSRADIEGGQGMFDDSCTVWFEVGFYKWKGYGVDQFMFEIVDGKLQSVSYESYTAKERVVMRRT